MTNLSDWFGVVTLRLIPPTKLGAKKVGAPTAGRERLMNHRTAPMADVRFRRRPR